MELYTRFRKGFGGKRLLESNFYIMHPIVIFTYFLGLFSFTFIYNNPIFTATNLLFAIAISLLYTEKSKLMGTIRMALFVGIFIILINPLTNHRGSKILFYLFDNPITLEATLYGIINAATLLCLFILFLPFNTLLDSERFLFLFAKISPRIAFIINMSLRYIGTFKRRAVEIIEVQKVRGININKGKTAHRVKTAGKLLEALVTFCLEEGMVISEVLKAKEYGSRKRTCYTFYKFIGIDFVMISIMVMLLISSFMFASYKIGNYSVFPRLKPLVFNPPTIIAYLMMVGFLLIPFILEFLGMKKRGKIQ